MITSMDQLVAALPASQVLPFYKPSMTSKGAGLFQSLWRAAGDPTSGAIPATGSGEVVTSATLGTPSFANAPSGDTLYIARSSFNAATIGHFFLVDRLVHTSGLSGTATTEQTVNTVALTRYTSGIGVQMAIEVYTATGSTQRNLTVKYTNQSGTPDRTTTFAFQTSPVAGQIMRIPFAAGDYGVRSVQSVTLDGTTGTAGDFGITLYKPLLDFPIAVANAGVFMDGIASGLPKIEDNAALSLIVLCSTTSTGICMGQFHLISG